MGIAFLRVICGQCGAETNKVEYDPDGRQAKVDQIASTLGIEPDAASAYVDTHGADPSAAAHTYAASLVDDTVSPCPAGHVGALKVVE
jgi:hypothetical protein